MRGSWRAAVALAPCVIAPIVLFTLWGPLAQDPAYHDFADRRDVFGVPFFGDVITNGLFVIVGLLGLFVLLGPNPPPTAVQRAPFVVFFAGLLGTGFGSGYYHLNPNDATLVWDRLPLALTVVGFFDAMVGERIDRKLGARLLAPLCIAAVASVFVWDWTGDLRMYALVQFCPVVSTALILLLCPGPYNDTGHMWLAIGAYALARIPEYFDHEVYDAIGLVSGHGIKHVLAALAAWLILRGVRVRASVSS